MGEIAWWKRIITKNDILKINLSGIKYIFGQEALSEYILKSKHSERDGASMSPKKSCFETIGKVLVDKDGNVDYKKLNEFFFQQPEKMPLQLKRRKEVKAILYNLVIPRAILHSEIVCM